MNKPEYKTDLFNCPHCGEKNNVSLISLTYIGIMWCSCGKVIKFIYDVDDIVKGIKTIYDFE